MQAFNSFNLSPTEITQWHSQHPELQDKDSCLDYLQICQQEADQLHFKIEDKIAQIEIVKNLHLIPSRGSMDIAGNHANAEIIRTNELHPLFNQLINNQLNMQFASKVLDLLW